MRAIYNTRNLFLYKTKIRVEHFACLIILAYAIAIQLIPAIASISIGILLSILLYPKFKDLALCACYLSLFSTKDITFGGLLSFSGVIYLIILNKEYLKITPAAICCFSMVVVYFLITFVTSFYQNIDGIYLAYFVKNMYKETILPVTIIMVFSCMKKNGFDFFNLMFLISSCISIGQIIAVATGRTEVLYVSYQFSISFVLLLFSKKVFVKVFSFLNISIYLFLLFKGLLYFSSQDVMNVIFVIVLYLILYRKKNLILFVVMFSVLSFSYGTIKNPNSFLQQKLNVSPQAAFKLTQIFLVMQSSTIGDIPWSPRVRIVETINSFNRNPFSIIFGSGFVSFVEESFVKYAYRPREGPGKNDYSDQEVLSGRYYGLHNTSRGLLHYGLIYFVMSFIVFFKSHRILKRHFSSNQNQSLTNIFLFILTWWNPYFTTFFFLLSNYFVLKNRYVNNNVKCLLV